MWEKLKQNNQQTFKQESRTLADLGSRLDKIAVLLTVLRCDLLAAMEASETDHLSDINTRHPKIYISEWCQYASDGCASVRALWRGKDKWQGVEEIGSARFGDEDNPVAVCYFCVLYRYIIYFVDMLVLCKYACVAWIRWSCVDVLAWDRCAFML